MGVTFKERVSFHLANQATPRPAKSGGKGAKPSRKRNMSQALRYARASARKDVRIFNSSNGLFENVKEAVEYMEMKEGARTAFRAKRGFGDETVAS